MSQGAGCSQLASRRKKRLKILLKKQSSYAIKLMLGLRAAPSILWLALHFPHSASVETAFCDLLTFSVSPRRKVCWCLKLDCLK